MIIWNYANMSILLGSVFYLLLKIIAHYKSFTLEIADLRWFIFYLSFIKKVHL